MTLPRPLLLLCGLLALVFATDLYSFEAATDPDADSDVWWVATAGRDMQATGAVPQRNEHAVTDSDVPWVMHEWLLAPLFAWGLERFGPAFFSVVTLVAFNAVAAVLLWVTVGSGASFLLSVACCLAGLFFFWVPLSARPTHLAVFFPVAMGALAFAPRFTRWHLLAAVGLSLAWTNLHGSFPLGIALLLAGAVAERTDRRPRLLAAGGAALATLVNPYGLGLHRLVWHYLRADAPIFAWLHAQVDEYWPLWRSAERHGKLPFGLALLCALALWGLTKPRLRARALLALGFVALAVLQVRNAQWVGPLGVVLLAPGLAALEVRSAAWGQALGALPPRLGRAIVASVALSGLAVGAVAHAATLRTRPPEAWYGWLSPVATLARKLPDGARVFAPFQAAALVTWVTAPRDGRVLFDSRNDCYAAGTAADAYALEVAPASVPAVDLLARDGVRQVITPTKSPLAGVLAAAGPAWHLTDTSGPFSLFEKAPL